MNRQTLIVVGLGIVALSPMLGFAMFAVSPSLEHPVSNVGAVFFFAGWGLGTVCLNLHGFRESVDLIYWVPVAIGFFMPCMSPVTFPVYWGLVVFTPWLRRRRLELAEEEIQEDLW